MTASQSNKFGFKRLSLENWLRVDPVWDAFGVSESSEAWVHDLLKANLDPVVPLPIRKLFETARGTLAYSLMFYPLLNDWHRADFPCSGSYRDKQMYGDERAFKGQKVFDKKIKWLSETGAIGHVQYIRWDAIRQLRNIASHPRDQNIFDPTRPSVCLMMLLN
jgi:hypothetical protein